MTEAETGLSPESVLTGGTGDRKICMKGVNARDDREDRGVYKTENPERK